MNELIKVITNENGDQLTSARDLYNELEIKKRFSEWWNSNTKGFLEGVDYTPYLEVHPQNKQEIQNYAMNLDMAKHLAMQTQSKKGFEIRQYFIEVEKVHKQFKIPTDPMEVLALTFEAQKQHKEELQLVGKRVTELEENAPLSPGDYGYISRLVNQRVATIIAERHLKLTQKQRSQLYKDLNSEIKKVTRVPSRTQLRQRHYDEVLQFILTWQPSSATIAIVNQLSLEELTDIA